MSSAKDRQRAAIRARLEREMATKAEQAALRRRRRNMIFGTSGGVVVAAVLVLVLVVVLGGGKKRKSASPSPSATAVSCTWLPNDGSSPVSTAPSSAGTPSAPSSPAASGAASPKASPNPYLKNVGTPPTTVATTGTPVMTVMTNLGAIAVSLQAAKAPCAVASFTYLASKKFFDNTSCYSTHDSGYYILQCGDPSGTGKGGPSYMYAPENLPTEARPSYTTGMVAVGTPPNSGNNGSQFFIVYKDTDDAPTTAGATPTSVLPGQFTVLGTVTKGMEVVDHVVSGGLTQTSSADAHTGKPKTPLTLTSVAVAPA